MSHSKNRRVAQLLIPVAAVALTAACGTDTADSKPTTSPVAAPPAAVTCGGAGIDDAAKIRYRTETVINAPLSTIWELQTDVERWPTWQKAVASLERLDQGTLRDGSQFEWKTPVPASPTTPATTLVITSSMHQVETGKCLRWSGPAVGEGLRIDNGIHVWTFTEVGGGVLVRTEENWSGAQVEADVPTSTTFLGAGLEAWLKDLKAAAEARS
ncbi:SRPBCC family protein [Nocardia sp. NPDC051832]|uniref:SRPBCC family protein n=1 Tax=Nocardia sp. NPDC051832 TaxID=3155673 RepID=UPI00343FB130